MKLTSFALEDKCQKPDGYLEELFEGMGWLLIGLH